MCGLTSDVAVLSVHVTSSRGNTVCRSKLLSVTAGDVSLAANVPSPLSLGRISFPVVNAIVPSIECILPDTLHL